MTTANLTSTDSLETPSWVKSHLKEWGITELTDIQSKALEDGVASGHSMVVSAPTSSGKTLVGEIALLAALRNNIKAIYLVSHKALADQKYHDFIHRFGESSSNPIASVGISTGDRSEGDINATLIVSTYEKALGLVLSGHLNVAECMIVADELQIISDPTRGPDVETLCVIIRKRLCKQFVALTAAVDNPETLATWLGCKLVVSGQRDVPLRQEIWYDNKVYQTVFGDTNTQTLDLSVSNTGNINEIVIQLLSMGRGPVLVFTESRNEASRGAEHLGRFRTSSGEGISIAEQLELFAEPTESANALRQSAEKCVTFHTADLSTDERRVIESGFTDSRFDVCFATSTLAAGVNYPFRSVVFLKLTYQWGDRAGKQISRTEYRNMSGRAGRLGMHEDGFAILLPRNELELAHSHNLVQPANDRVKSQLVQLSLRKSILTLIASGIANNIAQIMEFFNDTLYWDQSLRSKPALRKRLHEDSERAVEWLAEHDMLTGTAQGFLETPLGRATALSGLKPSTCVQLVSLLKSLKPRLSDSSDGWIPSVVYAICSTDEFCGERPSRFLPYVRQKFDSNAFWSGQDLLVSFRSADTRLSQSSHALVLYLNGIPERHITFQTLLTAGQVRRLAVDVAWVLDGLQRIAALPEISFTQQMSNKIALLSRRVRWGVPVEALDMLRAAEQHGVPGFGRQRAMQLVQKDIMSLQDVLGTSVDHLTKLLKNGQRARSLLEAVARVSDPRSSRFEGAHNKVAEELGILELVKAVYREQGTSFESAVVDLIRVESSWAVTVLDNGVRQNVPDILIQKGKVNVLIECKTCTKSPQVISKEDAWAVVQKSAGYDEFMARVSLGKPAFDETSKRKAANAGDITLVEFSDFVEGVLRVHTGSVSPVEFLNWISSPGIADTARLGGIPTFLG